MRQNTESVFKSWQQGKAQRRCAAVWTDGKHIYSYRTCIAALDETDGMVVLNRTRYSMTTTVHQNALAVLLGSVVKREMLQLREGVSYMDVLDRCDVVLDEQAA